jgi:hypothetical protein
MRKKESMLNKLVTISLILGTAMFSDFGQRAAAQNDQIDSNSSATLQYGKRCAEKLGPLPPFSCLDGKIIPVTVNGREVHEAVEKCDKPIYLGVGSGGRCKPNARLGRVDSGNPNVDTVFICRRYQNVTNSQQPGFSDVAIVQHHRVTGETCFFQALGSEDLYGKRVPPPNEVRVPESVRAEHPDAADANDFWIAPSGMSNIQCVRCHDSDPFIHTPYVDQVFLDAEKKIQMVPEDPFGQYKVIGTEFGTSNWPETFAVKSTSAVNGNCTTCHRIGSQSTCQEFAGDSVGSGAAVRSQIEPYKTEWAKEWRNARWMAPHELYANQGQWNHFVLPSATEQMRCCSLVNARRSSINSTLSASAIAEIESRGCKIEPISHNLP